MRTLELLLDLDRIAARRLSPSWAARAAARLRGRSLDQALLDGVDPAATSQLAARAARLTSRPMREEVASGLERLACTRPAGGGRWQVLPFRRAVAINSVELRAIASRVRGPGPVYARGIAMLRMLLTDGTGPAYTDRRGDELARQLRAARTAIGA